MRRAFLFIMAAMILFTWAAQAAQIGQVICFSSEAISASGNATGPTINLQKSLGTFSILVTVSGSGTAKLEYELSDDGSTWLEPTEASDICTGHTATSGPGSDGVDRYSFSTPIAKHMRIKCTETGGADSITVTAKLTLQ